jgi:hypothetical protein
MISWKEERNAEKYLQSKVTFPYQFGKPTPSTSHAEISIGFSQIDMGTSLCGRTSH